ncbi:acyltransferase family protein [Sinisalibacter lacisalsi]|uniref:Acyltransferase n=1 Tax=Sinisalibacter lacisalsi TaxID=1526570 RepID=A0ABQ1QKI8_9RHOB|nr:acyltransferase [Sinisalibacter lacisalsi]GGD28950.1 acyltransferase [Sinisalibacter lacisalsi]
MSRGFSIYLDAVRFAAGMLVLMSHFAYPRFSGGRWLWMRELNLGSDAVVMFFVLSGLVIAHVVHAKPGGAGTYAFDRATRFVSVALPALVLGFALDRMGTRIAPEVYPSWAYSHLPLWEILLRGLTFSNEWSGQATRLGSNGPYWSLSYEAAYYALFGIAIYARGARRIVLLALGGWIIGPNILLLLPAWLMGVLVQRCVARGRVTQGRAALALAVLPVAAYILALRFGVPDLLRAPIAEYGASLRFSDEFIWNNLLAGLMGVHLLGMAGLLRGRGTFRNATRIRWLAGGSFSLYLVHYPVLQVLAAMGLDSADLGEDLILIAATLAICYGFAELTERRLTVFRVALMRMRRWPNVRAGRRAPEAVGRSAACEKTG